MDDARKTQKFGELGSFILREYNRKTGIFSYDPEGFYLDIAQQAERICADEIRSVRKAADEARTKLGREITIYRLECELIISNAQIKTYERLFELSHSFIAAVSKIQINPEDELGNLRASLPKNLEYKPYHEDAYTAFSLALHDIMQEMYKTNGKHLSDFVSWTKRTFGHSTPER